MLEPWKSSSNVPEASQKAPGMSQSVNAFSMPSLSLPKGGGSLRSIDEKFSTNSANGTGSITIPIFASSGRSGLDPKLSISYNSGSGNGIFGLGWSLSSPSITRKTEKGLPKYDDSDESDIFVLSGAEDLVPVLIKNDNDETWIRKSTIVDGFIIHYYRPRIEGLFARIERWTNSETGETYWRSISRDNITTLYGRTSESRIANPSFENHVFEWLVCESFDDKGNAILYEYKRETSEGITAIELHERNRGEKSRSANLYFGRIRYGNRIPYYPYENENDSISARNDWMFEIVFDYGEGYYFENSDNVINDDGATIVLARHNNSSGSLNSWDVRQDEFSNYRSGFEIRTSRLCKSIKMVHHFPEELEIDDYVVGSTDFVYDESPITSFLTAVTHSSYLLQKNNVGGDSYLKKYLPPLEFGYSKAQIPQNEVHEVDDDFLENIQSSIGVASGNGRSGYLQWLDLDGEGLNGVLADHGGGWFYKRNVSTANFISKEGISSIEARFSPIEQVRSVPSLVGRPGQRYQLMDLAGDGRLDMVQFEAAGAGGGITSGFYERTTNECWDSFVEFVSIPNISWDDANLRFIDLTGDGLADILVTEDQALTFYRSLGERGYEYAERINKTFDEEKGPAVIFADSTQSIYLADISGDGLTDIVRIRNGEVCYWPNLGYGHFGSKITMDNSPWFDTPDHFDHQLIRLADIDGSGVTDIIYLGQDRISMYLNQSGNSWSDAKIIEYLPRIDNLSAIAAIDLLGNGTACLVWPSPSPVNARRSIRYIELTGGVKPHLLTMIKNNLGAKTRILYAPSTKFYLMDKLAGKSWITKLPFPVQVVEKVAVYDYISKNKFVTQYAYHHGFFDGVERSFNGFGMVEQMDTQEFDVIKEIEFYEDEKEEIITMTNIDESSHVPPALTKTWYHTGAYVRGGYISRQFQNEYYREPGLTDDNFVKMLLPDTILPLSLTAEEEREACRTLRGSILRTELYGLDNSPLRSQPYVITENSYTITKLQFIAANNQNGVFLVSPGETITHHYERNLSEPRTTHSLVLEVDEFGNMCKSVSIGYGRRQLDPELSHDDQQKQKQILITYTENEYTRLLVENDIIENKYTKLLDIENLYRSPVVCENRVYELVGLGFDNIDNNSIYFDLQSVKDAATSEAIPINYEDDPPNDQDFFKRLIEHNRTVFRKDDLSGPLELGQIQSRALSFQSYALAFTPGLITKIYEDKVTDGMLSDLDKGRYVHFPQGDPNWWILSSRVFYSPGVNDSPQQELVFAKDHFFLPHRSEDPFGNSSTLKYDDDNKLLLQETRDPLDNVVSVAELDYRLLQPSIITDPNGNISAVACDILGLVTGTAVMGKTSESIGDSLDQFDPNLDINEILNNIETPPLDNPHSILKGATSCMIYDLFQYKRTSNTANPMPSVIYTMVREIHASDQTQNQLSRVQHSFSYFDGFGREIQKKVQAESGDVDSVHMEDRWAGSGWIIYNNISKSVRQYEPFFSDTHKFQFAKQVGVSSILFYDPVGRVVATLYPNNTYEKIVFDPWTQKTYDVNDTVMLDPRTDEDVREYMDKYFDTQLGWQTWHDERIGQGPDSYDRKAALKTEAHTDTPKVAHFDTMGRTFLTIAINGDDQYKTHVRLDIEGNQREVVDAKGRIVMRYEYDILGNQIMQASMDAGTRRVLNNIMGNPIFSWDSRDFERHMTYDELHRPLEIFVGATSGTEFLAEKTIYGESKQPDPEITNHRMRIWEVRDGVGILVNELYDFKGNLLLNKRQLLSDYKTQVDWSQNQELEDEIFVGRTLYDALNRPIQIIAPHSNEPGTKINVIQRVYNLANLLEQVDIWLAQDSEPVEELLESDTASHHFVKNIDYNAKGQRKLIEYGNGVKTFYEYDDKTFRLRHLDTIRVAKHLQRLSYVYDPIGNITHIQEDSDIQDDIFRHNMIIKPHTDYIYDAIYRLKEATGREHIGQSIVNNCPVPTNHDDEFRMRLNSPADPNSMGLYEEEYSYDSVGNILKIKHRNTDPSHSGWSRHYNYNEPSLLQPTIDNNNRLSNTTISGCNPVTESYIYDSDGNIIKMPHLVKHQDPLAANMHFDFKDQLQQVDMNRDSVAYYAYDAAGQRAHKVWEKSPGLSEERIYLGLFEVFRKRNGSGDVTLERETLNVMDDTQRIALVETRTEGNELHVPIQLIRYQFGNHLGSAMLELNDQAQIISYEEYTPYGSVSYQAVQNDVEVPQKRYRYTGKERDEETGFYYYGSRYYAPWLGRWTSPDRAGFVDGTNLYWYVRNNPVRFVDPNGQETKQQKWLKEFRQREPENEGIGYENYIYMLSSRDEGILTVTGVRVPIYPGNLLSPRPFYENKTAALIAYYGFIHYAELIEAEHIREAYRIAERTALASNEGRRTNPFGKGDKRWVRDIPYDSELNLDAHVDLAINNKIVRDIAGTVAAAAGAMTTVAQMRAAYVAGKAESMAATRAVGTQQALLDPPISRVITSAGDRTFRHTVRTDMPLASAVQIEQAGSLKLSTGINAHYGPGVYAWEAGATNVGKYVDFKVNPGTAVEEIITSTGAKFYRIVPAKGDNLTINIVGTNFTKEELDFGRKILGIGSGAGKKTK